MASPSISEETNPPIEISVGRHSKALVDAADYPLLASFRWYLRNSDNTSYAYALIEGRSVLMHRFILAAPKGVSIDHVNGNGLDNRRENLRFAKTAENSANITAPPRGRTGIRGVYFIEGRWVAKYGGKFLGSAATADEAVRIYNAHVIALRGEFARPHETPIEGRLDWLCVKLGLSDLEAEVLVMNAEGGLAYDVIAERLEITLDSVRNAITRIKAKVEFYQDRKEEKEELRAARKQTNIAPRWSNRVGS